MNKEAFNKMDRGWFDKLSPFLLSEEFDKIINTLREEGKTRNIYPPANLLFRSFEECKYDNLKCIIILQDPYYQPGVADGIPMSCSRTKRLQPSLQLFYDAINKTVYDRSIDPSRSYNPDLTYLLQQGVMLLNTALTVRENEPGSHVKLWEPFTKFLFEEVLSSYNSGLPIMMLGKDAQKMNAYIVPFMHYTLDLEHPAFAKRQNREWNCKDCFNWTNRIIRENNGKEFEIEWMENIQ